MYEEPKRRWRVTLDNGVVRTVSGHDISASEGMIAILTSMEPEKASIFPERHVISCEEI